jgi:hypothetical protein
MAVSGDGYLARGPDDDMSWTGPLDKAVFRALTAIGGVVAAGSHTFDLMPKVLHGRTLLRLSRTSILSWSLEQLARVQPGAWLVGGPTVVRAALDSNLVAEVHLCRLMRVRLFYEPAGESDCSDGRISMDVLHPPVATEAFPIEMTTRFDESLIVQTYRVAT